MAEEKEEVKCTEMKDIMKNTHAMCINMEQYRGAEDEVKEKNIKE